MKYAKEDGNTTIMITGAIGLIMGVVFCVLLLVPIPMFNCSLGKESYICLAIWVLLGLVFNIVSKKNK